MVPIPGHNLKLNHDSWSKFNVELIPRVIIQRGIKSPGHNSTGGPNFIRRRGHNSMTPVSWIAIQHEKFVESKIQSYTGSLICIAKFPRVAHGQPTLFSTEMATFSYLDVADCQLGCPLFQYTEEGAACLVWQNSHV